MSNQARIEALENRVLRQDEQIDKVNDKLSIMDINGVIVKRTRTLKPSRRKMPHLKSTWLQLRHPSNSHHKKQSRPSNQRNVVCAVKLLKEIATLKTI